MAVTRWKLVCYKRRPWHSHLFTPRLHSGRMIRLMHRCLGILLAASIGAQPPNGVWVVGHRGFKAVAPENTIASFEAAAAVGTDYMELDVHQTKDGELVLMHDSKVDRTTNGKGAVRDLTLVEIKRLNAGQGQHIPTLREALLWAKTKG